ncbi:FAD-dependent oxidoreductase, partial [Burkholderia cenocepacia]|nr:FAD-dependent oxidoreductase [Burkholderia cenocepacia]
VIDGAQPGWGASGRNGGQVIPGLKYDPDELVRRPRRQGWIQPAPTAAMLDTVARRAQQWAARGGRPCRASRRSAR